MKGKGEGNGEILVEVERRRNEGKSGLVQDIFPRLNKHMTHRPRCKTPMYRQWRSEGRPGRARARPKAPCSSRSCHAISCKACTSG